MTKIFVFTLLSAVLFLGALSSANAQEKKALQLTGIILGEDSTSGVPGVHVLVPRRGAGTVSNYVGYFSLPVLVGDSIVFSSVGYKRQSYIVPDFGDQLHTLIVELVTDTTYLEDNIVVMPFPTEEVFKEAVLAMNIPTEDPVSDAHLGQELLILMMRSAPMTPEANYKYYMDEMIYQNQYRYSMRPNPFLNPLNWAKFIKSLKEKKNR